MSATSPSTSRGTRVVALALEAVNNLGLDWEDFQRRLIAALAEDEHRPYYDLADRASSGLRWRRRNQRERPR